MTTFLENYGNLIDKIFGNFDRPFKEIEQYKLYRKDDKGSYYRECQRLYP